MTMKAYSGNLIRKVVAPSGVEFEVRGLSVADVAEVADSLVSLSPRKTDGGPVLTKERVDFMRKLFGKCIISPKIIFDVAESTEGGIMFDALSMGDAMFLLDAINVVSGLYGADAEKARKALSGEKFPSNP